MIKVVIFDVDGTLLDSFEANFMFFKNLMTAAGYPVPTRERYATLFHLTLRDAVRVLTGSTDEDEVTRVKDLVDEVDAPSPIMTEGAPGVVAALSERYVLAIATSRIKEYAFEPPLDTLRPYFAVAATYEDTEKHKPDPDPLLFAARELGVAPAECVYVGDVRTDMDAAIAAGMKFILYAKENIDGASGRTDDFRNIPQLIDALG